MTAGQASVVPLQETSHLHEDEQFTVPHDGSRPVQVALHSPVPQFMVPQAALPPAQVWMHLPLPQLSPAQALLPWQSAVQSPLEQLTVPQAALPLPPEHETSQLPLVQPMLPHARGPMHETLQSCVLHWMPRHALPAVHLTSHDAEFVQLIVPHAPVVGHSMLQFQPVGQVRLPLPVPTIVHVNVAKSQVPLQIGGHTAASAGRASSSGF